jgi:hypothetical protein
MKSVNVTIINCVNNNKKIKAALPNREIRGERSCTRHANGKEKSALPLNTLTELAKFVFQLYLIGEIGFIGNYEQLMCSYSRCVELICLPCLKFSSESYVISI